MQDISHRSREWVLLERERQQKIVRGWRTRPVPCAERQQGWWFRDAAGSPQAALFFLGTAECDQSGQRKIGTRRSAILCPPVSWGRSVIVARSVGQNAQKWSQRDHVEKSRDTAILKSAQCPRYVHTKVKKHAASRAEVEKHRSELADQLLDSVLKGSASGVERMLANGGECRHRSHHTIPVVVFHQVV